MEEWAESQGPNLPMGPRVLLRELARYANCATGRCWPAQETIADSLECSSRSVRTWADLLATGGFLTVELVVDNAGHKHLIYQLTGAASGWKVTRERSRGGGSLVKHHLSQINQLQLQLDAALAMLGVTDAPVETPPEKYSSGGVDVAAGSSVEPERESLSENPVEKEISLSNGSVETPVPPEKYSSGGSEKDQIKDLVKAEWQLLASAPPGHRAWEVMGGAIKHYLDLGLDQLKNDLAARRAAQSTCAHCGTIHETKDSVRSCSVCNQLKCQVMVGSASCTDHRCTLGPRSAPGSLRSRINQVGVRCPHPPDPNNLIGVAAARAPRL